MQCELTHVELTLAWVNSHRGILESLVGSEQFLLGEDRILTFNKKKSDSEPIAQIFLE